MNEFKSMEEGMRVFKKLVTLLWKLNLDRQNVYFTEEMYDYIVRIERG